MLGVSDAMGKFMRFKPQLVEAAAVDNCNSHLFNHAQRRARLLKAVGADPDEPAMPARLQGIWPKRPRPCVPATGTNWPPSSPRMPWRTTRPPSNRPSARELSDLADAALEGALAIARHETEAASTCASPSSAWANSAHRN